MAISLARKQPAVSAARHHGTAWSIRSVLVITILLVVVLVGIPLAMLIWGSFRLGGEGVSLNNYTRVFTEPRLYGSIWNSLKIGVGSTLLCLAIGVPIAWVIARTNVPGRGMFRVMTAIAFITPAYQGAIAYMILMGPNAGYMNRWFISLFGTETGPFNIFSIWGIIFVTTINTFPYVVFLVGAALSSVDGRLEESARILGASESRVLTGITWKLVTPALFASMLLVLVHGMSLFGSHAFLGMPRGIYTLPTRIFTMLGYPPDYAGAASLSMILVIITVVVLFWQRRFLAKRSYVTISGKAAKPTMYELGKSARWMAAGACHLLFAFAVYLPVAFLLWTSFARHQMLGFAMDNFTLQNYQNLPGGLTGRSLKNSVVLGVSTASITMLLGAVVAYLTIRIRGRAVKILDYLSMIPLGLPGIILAVGILLTWIRVPLGVYATAWILLIAYMAKTLPLSVRASDSAVRQIDPSLEEAAHSLGASRLRGMRDITIPLMWSGLLAAWSLVFIQAFQELAVTMLLYSAGNETAPVAIFLRTQDGRMEEVAALSMTVLFVILVVLGIANKLSHGAVARRFG